MLSRLVSTLLVCLLATQTSSLDTGTRETVLLVNNKPLDVQWEKCLNTRACIQTNVIDRVAELETKIANVSFGEVPEEKGTFISLSPRIKMKMIKKEDGKIAFRFVANNSPAADGRGMIAEKHKAILIGFAIVLYVLGVITTTLKVNVFLALLGVAVGKILLLYVYTEHLEHKYHHHPHGAGLHIHKAPTYYKTHAPVQVIEHVPVVPEYHDHHYDHHDHYDHHGDWDIIRKKKSMEISSNSVTRTLNSSVNRALNS